MRPKALKIEYVGTTEAVNFLRKHHGDYRLPNDEIFAFANERGSADPVYVLVSERDLRLEIVGSSWASELDLQDRQIDMLLAHAAKEAKACGVDAPYSVSLINAMGVLSLPVKHDDMMHFRGKDAA